MVSHGLEEIQVRHIHPPIPLIIGKGVDNFAFRIDEADGPDVVLAGFVEFQDGSFTFLVEIDDVGMMRQMLKYLEVLLKETFDSRLGLPGVGHLLFVQFLDGDMLHPLIGCKKEVKTGNHEDQNGGQKQPAFQSLFLASPNTAAV